MRGECESTMESGDRVVTEGKVYECESIMKVRARMRGNTVCRSCGESAGGD